MYVENTCIYINTTYIPLYSVLARRSRGKGSWWVCWCGFRDSPCGRRTSLFSSFVAVAWRFCAQASCLCSVDFLFFSFFFLYCGVRVAERFLFCFVSLESFVQGKMNDSDVSKQVQQMVHFIKQEAEEKANEISVAAEEVNPEFCFLIRSGKMERKQKTKKIKRCRCF